MLKYFVIPREIMLNWIELFHNMSKIMFNTMLNNVARFEFDITPLPL